MTNFERKSRKPPRLETTEFGTFITSRTRNSEMWFANNREFEEACLGQLAKVTKRYQAKVYAFSLQFNHIHLPVDFDYPVRAAFVRDLKSWMAKSIKRYQPKYPGGVFWGSRYSGEYIADNESYEDRFFYTVLQPVKDGLVNDIRDYPGYNCFFDAVSGRTLKYKVVNWSEYNSRRRFNKNLRIEDFTEIVEFQYARLPGYEELPQEEYKKLMEEKLAERTAALLQKRKEEGKHNCLGREGILLVKPGSVPKKTKTTGIRDFRPRIFFKRKDSRERCVGWYLSKINAYREASYRYRRGELNVEFPPGTYKPLFFCGAGPPE